jgi:hypothetical protein
LPRFINSTRTVINSTRTVINSTRTGTFLDDIFRTDRDIATKFSTEWPTADSNRRAKFGWGGSSRSDAIRVAPFINSTRTGYLSTRTGINSTRTVINSTRTGFRFWTISCERMKISRRNFLQSGPPPIPTDVPSLVTLALTARTPSSVPHFINSTRTGINSTRTVINSTRTGTFLDDIFRTDQGITTKFSAEWPTANTNRRAKFGYAGYNGSDAIVRAAFHQFNPHSHQFNPHRYVFRRYLSNG